MCVYINVVPCVYVFFLYSVGRDGARFVADLGNNLRRPFGFEALMRIRCSEGVDSITRARTENERKRESESERERSVSLCCQ